MRANYAAHKYDTGVFILGDNLLSILVLIHIVSVQFFFFMYINVYEYKKDNWY